MISPVRLESYMRRAAALTHDTVEMPPFALFFNPHDALRFFNYARPIEPVGGDLGGPLDRLCEAFAARERMPRFEFVEEYTPALAEALARAGFTLEDRCLLMVCTPETLRPAPAVAGLELVTLGPSSPAADVRAYTNVGRSAFGDPEIEVSDAAAEQFRRKLVENGAFLARLDDAVVGVAGYTAPLDGLTELVGIATREDYRRRGVATALTAYAVQAAYDQGVGAAFLTAADERAGRVYERVGFRAQATSLAYYKEL